MLTDDNWVAECLAASVTALEEHQLAVNFKEIHNCVQYSHGDIEVRLEVTDKAIISFKNPVKPTASVDITRLFDRFYTGDKARNTGTGLGLSIVRLLAEQMNGSTSASLQDGVLDIRVELPLYVNSP